MLRIQAIDASLFSHKFFIESLLNYVQSVTKLIIKKNRAKKKNNILNTLRCQHLPFAVDLKVDRKFVHDPLSIIPIRQIDPILKPF